MNPNGDTGLRVLPRSSPGTHLPPLGSMPSTSGELPIGTRVTVCTEGGWENGIVGAVESEIEESQETVVLHRVDYDNGHQKLHNLSQLDVRLLSEEEESDPARRSAHPPDLHRQPGDEGHAAGMPPEEVQGVAMVDGGDGQQADPESAAHLMLGLGRKLTAGAPAAAASSRAGWPLAILWS